MKRPNILIFMTDQQRGDSIPPYSKAITPNLDKFCREGITFDNAFTISPHCCPSRATFFSGLYPSQHGVWNNVGVGNTLSKGLYEKVRLFSEDLKDAGYNMFYTGKWHVSDVESPLNRGFDVVKFADPFDKSLLKHERPHIKEWGQYKGFKQQTERNRAQIIRKGYPAYTHYGERDEHYYDRQVVDEALNIINTREKSIKPWCQFVGPVGPHDPYFVAQKYLDMYDIDDIKLPENFKDKMKDKPSLYRRTRDRFNQLTEEEHKEAIRHYLAFCTYEDTLFGEILKALEKTEEIENTLVLYVSDHGDYMAEHGLWCKGLPCFKGAYHIPAVIRWPQGIKNPGREVREFVTLSDFAPTFLEIAGIRTNREFTGQSLVPLFNNERLENWRDAVFTQSNGNELFGIQRSVFTKEWKFVYNGFDYDELYDLKNDPDEMNNLIGNNKYDEVIQDMYKRLWKFAYRTADVCINSYIAVSLASYGPGVAFGE